MQFRLFVPYGTDTGRVTEPLREILAVRDVAESGYAPQRQENVRECLLADIRTDSSDLMRFADAQPKYQGSGLGIKCVDQFTFTYDGRCWGFVTAFQPIGDIDESKQSAFRERLQRIGHGTLFRAMYPVLDTELGKKGRGYSSILVLEGEGKPDFLREQVDRVLRQACGERYAFSEELMLERF